MPTHPPAMMRQPGSATAQLRRTGGSSPQRVAPLVTPEALGTTSARLRQLLLWTSWPAGTPPLRR